MHGSQLTSQSFGVSLYRISVCNSCHAYVQKLRLHGEGTDTLFEGDIGQLYFLFIND